eukprot:m51a1_g453 hypothetical protein (935) ;mRNA; r:141906-144772
MEAPLGRVLQAGNTRITFLTDRVLRLEYSPTGLFEDRPTVVFAARARSLVAPVHLTPTPDAPAGPSVLSARSPFVSVTYTGPAPFSRDNLVVRFAMSAAQPTGGDSDGGDGGDGDGGGEGQWRPGDAATGNLFGAIRTLDGKEGAVDMAKQRPRRLWSLGVCSRDGWALVDDSRSGVLVETREWKSGQWCAERPASGDAQQQQGIDWYLFAHGRDYKGALRDYVLLTGDVPVPPRWAMGVWHSQWYPHGQEDLLRLADDFEAEGLPLDVITTDMDWHSTSNGLAPSIFNCWGGYSWEPRLFPDPKGFVDEMHAKGVKLSVNLHPVDGIPAFEKRFKEVCDAVGADSASSRGLPMDVWDPKWAHALTSIVLPDVMADVHWIDYQAEEKAVKGVVPTLWLAHVFCTGVERTTPDGRSLRPIKLSPWGGLGSHRYAVGHSGDTCATWGSLNFQPFFTCCGANVAFGHWSHDIGGFEEAEKEPYSPELFVRWVQWGCLSPVMRTHCSRSSERRFWMFGHPWTSVARDALKLRKSLVPYIYTCARRLHDEGLSAVLPLYYEWPWMEEAYKYQNQYMFGPDMMVRPVTSPVHPIGGVAVVDVWIPPGTWVHTQWLKAYRGPAVVTLRCTLRDTPMFVRAGAVIPRCSSTTPAGKIPDVLELHAYSLPESNQPVVSRCYEDDGETVDYLEQMGTRNKYSWSEITFTRDGDLGLRLKVAPNGDFEGAPYSRSYVLYFYGIPPPSSILCGNSEAVRVPFKQMLPQGSQYGACPTYWYDAVQICTVVSVPSVWGASFELFISLPVPADPSAWLSGLCGLAGRCAELKAELDANFEERDEWPEQLKACQQIVPKLKSASADAKKLQATIQESLAVVKEATVLAQQVAGGGPWPVSFPQRAAALIQLEGPLPPSLQEKPKPSADGPVIAAALHHAQRKVQRHCTVC